MNSNDYLKLKAQVDANTAALSRTEQKINHKLTQEKTMSERDPYDQQYQNYNPYYAQDPQQQYTDPYGQGIDPNEVVLQSITNAAAKKAMRAVTAAQSTARATEENVRTRMNRLTADFPALADETSDLVDKSRKVYQRIASENPGLDEATKYELAVREAASSIGARPVTISPEESGWTMPTGHNPAISKKSTKSRLTSAIVANARLMGINVDPKSSEGQKNLKELSEYSARFNADVNEDHLKYR